MQNYLTFKGCINWAILTGIYVHSTASQKCQVSGLNSLGYKNQRSQNGTTAISWFDCFQYLVLKETKKKVICDEDKSRRLGKERVWLDKKEERQNKWTSLDENGQTSAPSPTWLEQNSQTKDEWTNWKTTKTKLCLLCKLVVGRLVGWWGGNLSTSYFLCLK